MSRSARNSLTEFDARYDFYLRAAIGGGRFRDAFKHEVLQIFGLSLEGHAEGAFVGGELSAVTRCAPV